MSLFSRLEPLLDQVSKPIQYVGGELNSQLNHWETIKRFLILDRDLTVNDGDLTPSMKLKRKVVAEKYRDELDSLYA